MSNLLLNLRIACWHFQIMRDRPWVRFGFNRYRWEHGHRRPIVEFHR